MPRTNEPDNLIAANKALPPEIIVRLNPAPQELGHGAREKNFVARIYSSVAIPFLPPPEAFPDHQRYVDERSRADLPLVGLEILAPGDIGALYNAFRQSLTTGDFFPLADALRATLPPALRAILCDPDALSSGANGDSGPQTRIWWSGKTNELSDLPWELIVAPNRRFLRGTPVLPAVSPPPIALEDTGLRVLLVHGGVGQLPPALPELEIALGQAGIACDVATEIAVRESLQTAIRGDYHAIHLFCDGVVLSSQQGVLQLTQDDGDETEAWAETAGDDNDKAAPERREIVTLLSSTEASRLLCGSRVATLALSPLTAPAVTQPLPNASGSPATFADTLATRRAFVLFASADSPLPTILFPLLADAPASVWATFYKTLAQTGRAEDAAAAAQQNGSTVFPLFLAHRQTQTLEEYAQGVTEAHRAHFLDDSVLGNGGNLAAEDALRILPTVGDLFRSRSIIEAFRGDPSGNGPIVAAATMESFAADAPAPLPPAALQAQHDVLQRMVKRLREIEKRTNTTMPFGVEEILQAEETRQAARSSA